MNLKERMDRINDVLDSDFAFEADCISSGLAEGTETEIALSKLIMDIYRFSHPAGGCSACHDPDVDIMTIKKSKVRPFQH